MANLSHKVGDPSLIYAWGIGLTKHMARRTEQCGNETAPLNPPLSGKTLRMPRHPNLCTFGSCALSVVLRCVQRPR